MTNFIQYVTENSLYISIGMLIFFGLMGIIVAKWVKTSQKPDPVVDAFFTKYNLMNLPDDEAVRKLREIADINSNYPDDDKKMAQGLTRILK